jgi:hypothetical protein
MEFKSPRNKDERLSNPFARKTPLSGPQRGRSPPKSLLLVQNVQISAIQQVAFEGLDDGVDFPFGPPLVLQQVADTVPAPGAEKLAVLTLIEELAVLLAHIFFIFLAIFDFHGLPSLFTLSF